MLALRQTRTLIWSKRWSKIGRTFYHQSQKMFTAAVEAEEKLPPPQLEQSNKVYQPNIVKIVDEISQLSLLEVAELNELLKVRLNISEAPMMAVGQVASSGPVEAEEEAPGVKQQTEFTVRLTAFKADSKIKLIKAVKALLPDLNLVKAKSFVESLPQVVRKDVPKDEAEEVHKTLTDAGATAVIE